MKTAGARIDLAVDAHHLTPHVDQRATRIAWIDRHIGLNKGQVIAGISLLGTDDAGRDRVLQAKGRTNRHDPLAHLHAIGIADFYGWQTGGFNLDQRHIGAFVGTNDLGLELALVRQCYQHLVGAFYNVRIGHHQAIGREDESRADATRLLFVLLAPFRSWRARHVGWHRNAEAAKKLKHLFVRAAGRTSLGFFQRADVNHRRADSLNQVREVRQAAGLGHQRLRWQQGQRAAPCQRSGHDPAAAMFRVQFKHHQP